MSAPPVPEALGQVLEKLEAAAKLMDAAVAEGPAWARSGLRELQAEVGTARERARNAIKAIGGSA